MESQLNLKPSGAFVAASWIVLLVGVASFVFGLINPKTGMDLSEKGYYFTVLMFGLFSAISLQKTVRDQLEGIPTTSVYYGLAWFTTILSLVLLIIGLWNAKGLELSEKGFYGMSFLVSLFAAISVQKNIRDVQLASKLNDLNP